MISDVNKDWTCKDKDKDKDQAYKDQDKDKDKDQAYKDKDKDLNLVLKESLRTRTRINIIGLY